MVIQLYVKPEHVAFLKTARARCRTRKVSLSSLVIALLGQEFNRDKKHHAAPAVRKALARKRAAA